MGSQLIFAQRLKHPFGPRWEPESRRSMKQFAHHSPPQGRLLGRRCGCTGDQCRIPCSRICVAASTRLSSPTMSLQPSPPFVLSRAPSRPSRARPSAQLIARLPDESWQDDAIIASAMGASFRAAGSPRGSSAIGYFHAAENALAGADPTGTDHSRDPERVAILLGRAAALRAVGRLEAANAYVAKAQALDTSNAVLPVAIRVELGARGALERGLIELHLGKIDAAQHLLEHAHGLAAQTLSRAEQIECLGGLALVEYANSNFDTALAARRRGSKLSRAAQRSGRAATRPLPWSRRSSSRSTGTISRRRRGSSPRCWKPRPRQTSNRSRMPSPATGCWPSDGSRRPSTSFSSPLAATARGHRVVSGSAVGELMRAGILVHLNQSDEAWAILRDLQPFEHHVICPGAGDRPTAVRPRRPHGRGGGASRLREARRRALAAHDDRGAPAACRDRVRTRRLPDLRLDDGSRPRHDRPHRSPCPAALHSAGNARGPDRRAP